MFAMISVCAGYGTDGSTTPTIVADAIAQPDGLADDRRVARQRGRPEPMGQHRRARGLRPIVGRVEQAAPHRAKSHDLEVRAADDPGAHHARLAEADHREVDGGELAERRQRLDARAQVPDLRDRELGVLGADAARALANVDQAILVLVDERPQQDAPDDAEDRRVGADAERQGEDDRDRQPFDPGQRPQRKLEIGDEAHTVNSIQVSGIDTSHDRRLPPSALRVQLPDRPTSMLPSRAGGIFDATWIASFRSLASIR